MAHVARILGEPAAFGRFDERGWPYKRDVPLIAPRAFGMGAGEQVVGLVLDEKAATLEYWLDGKYQGCVFSNLPPGISLEVVCKFSLQGALSVTFSADRLSECSRDQCDI